MCHEHLIGKVGELKKKKNTVDYKQLSKPLEWGQAVCRVVCKNCNTISEANLNYATNLLNVMTLLGKDYSIMEGRLNFFGLYFEISFCEQCLKGKKPKEVNVDLKRIPRLN